MDRVARPPGRGARRRRREGVRHRARHACEAVRPRGAAATRRLSAAWEASAVARRWRRGKAWFDATHAGRTITRYGAHQGNVLAAGIAYYSLSSLAASLVLAATGASLVGQTVPGARRAVFDVLGALIPGSVGDDGLVSPDARIVVPVAGVVGVAALLAVVNTATRVLGGLRAGVRVMLGRAAGGGIAAKASDAVALGALLVVVIAGAALQVASSRAADWLARVLPWGEVESWAVRVPAIAAGLVVDGLFVAVALVLLGGARGRARRLVAVLVVAAVAIGALRQASSALVASALDNPVLASFAAVVTVLVFVDLVTRVVLHAAAWLGAARVVAAGADDAAEGLAVDVPMARRRVGVTTRRVVVRGR